jgi:hypothetical protein
MVVLGVGDSAERDDGRTVRAATAEPVERSCVE